MNLGSMAVRTNKAVLGYLCFRQIELFLGGSTITMSTKYIIFSIWSLLCVRRWCTFTKIFLYSIMPLATVSLNPKFVPFSNLSYIAVIYYIMNYDQPQLNIFTTITLIYYNHSITP